MYGVQQEHGDDPGNDERSDGHADSPRSASPRWLPGTVGYSQGSGHVVDLWGRGLGRLRLGFRCRPYRWSPARWLRRTCWLWRSRCWPWCCDRWRSFLLSLLCRGLTEQLVKLITTNNCPYRRKMAI